MSEFKKFDKEKLRYDLLPADSLEEIVKVLTHGSIKYGDNNWIAGCNWTRYFAALMRHSWKWFSGEKYDKESGLHHLAHAGCCILFLLGYDLRNMTQYDNRPKIEIMNENGKK